jgi:putative tryptophan/tyrosine transport system substrate-binding protein
MLDVRRRELIALLGGAAAAWPLTARAQRPFMAPAASRPVIGYLAVAASASVLRSATALALISALRGQGYSEGRDIDIIYRFADGFFDRLPALAEELVRLRPDAILAPATIAAQAARAATTTIPIVCPLLDNPVRLGLVASDSRPGGNVTGLLRHVDGLGGKHVELARESIPGMSRIGLLANVASAETTPRRDVEVAAAKSGMSVVLVEVAAPNDLDAAFQKLAHERTQAVIVLHDSLFFSERRRIVTLAAAGRLPTIWTTREFAEDGGLITYGLDEGDSFRRAAGYLVKILRGAKAGDLPIELPVKFELVINLKTAKALGIDVPPTLLARADEVIE